MDDFSWSACQSINLQVQVLQVQVAPVKVKNNLLFRVILGSSSYLASSNPKNPIYIELFRVILINSWTLIQYGTM